MEEFIRVQDQYYILATSSRADDRTQVLKHGETFGVFDHHGDIVPFGLGEQGLYHEGTRFLSRLDLRMGKPRPLLLSSTVKDDNDLLTVDLTNPDISRHGDVVLCRGTLHIFRSKFLWQGSCYESLRVCNHGLIPVEVSLAFLFEADFADIFEVRGIKRARRGEKLPDSLDGGTVELAYQGLDGVVRRTRLEWSPPPRELTSSSARLELRLEPKAETTCFLTVTCQSEPSAAPRLPHAQAYASAVEAVVRAKDRLSKVHTSNEQFNEWLERSVADCHMMLTETESGPYPHAGVPWFSTFFGRDGIITALELLWVEPRVARGVLGYLARNQARSVVPEEDAEPGKVLHETRRGEMAALGEIPFGRYYGSVDATPLFVMLAGAYYCRTGDRAFIESIWGEIELALKWIDTFGDPDGDGFVEYQRRSQQGLIHQGWKDSHDAVFHQDGELAQGPIALCEVQAYAYAARRRAAELALVLGRDETAGRLWRQARTLQELFERTFWCEELSTYALALDGGKRPCRVRASNAGHCLLSGIAGPERARVVGRTLLEESSFSGWGIRTLAASEVRYNPMSYHNGSVWPHDNTLIALGLSRYGMGDHVQRVLTGLFEASAAFDLHRLPELFCGFPRRHAEGPTLYPVACAPQAWASASVFMLLQASLGLSIESPRREIRFTRPQLPDFLGTVRIERLEVAGSEVDLLLSRRARDVEVEVLRREGEVSVVVLK